MAKRHKPLKSKQSVNRPALIPVRSQTTYPDEQTWHRLVLQRQQILRQLITSFVQNKPGDVVRLVEQYGAYEVNYVLQKYQEASAKPFLTDESAIYRHYRVLYAQFGGNRPFLTRQGYDAAIDQESATILQKMRQVLGWGGPDMVLESERLTHLAYATDITPPHIPPKPATFACPLPHLCGATLTPLLNLGWQLDEAAIKPYLAPLKQWHTVLPELCQMAIDPGLVNGWPGETASWAPYHALTLLERLRPHQYAGDLLALLEIKDDWLTDRLPHIWAQMGPLAAAPLWEKLENKAYPDKKLAVILAGLLAIAKAHVDQAKDMIPRFIHLLATNPTKRSDLNSYLIYVLDELFAPTAIPAIQTAFKENRVNLHVISPGSVNLLGARLD